VSAVATTVLRRPVAAALVVIAALVLVTVPAVTGAAPACAAAGPHAALVIDTGAGVRSFCVALDATTVSGIHLIELAGAQDHLSYGFGSGGQAVCRLAGVGPQGDDCFADYPQYWGYWHGDGQGGWTWSPSGAASARVGDGALDGWVWGSGDSGATHPKPPPTAIDDVCVPAAAPAASPSPSRATSAAAAPSPGVRSSAPASAGASDPGTTRSAKSPHEGIGKTSAPAGPPTAGALAAATGPAAANAGPGPGLFVALVLGAALAGGGWLRMRTSRRGRSVG
jgi:hypothetical protein